VIADALAHQYLRHALEAGLLVALVSGATGYFVVVRGSAFAAHAVAQIGFAGAAAAVYAGVAPLTGLLAAAVLGALGLGSLSARARGGDVTIALVLVAALGTGSLFIALTPHFASTAIDLLFGTIVGVDGGEVATISITVALALAALAAIARPLLFVTVAPDVARVRGVPAQALDVAFLGIVALAAAVTVPIAGALLIYSLTIGPAAAATHLARRPVAAIVLAIALASLAVVGGVALAYVTSWPVGFFIATICALEYLGSRIATARRRLPAALHG